MFSPISVLRSHLWQALREYGGLRLTPHRLAFKINSLSAVVSLQSFLFLSFSVYQGSTHQDLQPQTNSELIKVSESPGLLEPDESEYLFEFESMVTFKHIVSGKSWYKINLLMYSC